MIQIPTPLEENSAPLPVDWEHTRQEYIKGADLQARNGLLVVRLTAPRPGRMGVVNAPIRKHRITPN